MPDRCAPTTAIAMSSPADAGSGASWRLRQRFGADGQLGVGMEDAADAGKLRVAAGGREQRDAEWNAIVPHRGRQGQPAEVKQVDKIGVGAEPRVELDRIGQHLRGGIGGRRRRQHDRIELGKGALGNAAQRLQTIERGKSVGGGQPRAGRGDLARHRVDRIRRRRQQIADHQIAFRDPRSLIQQPRGLIERLEVEFDQRCAERAPALQRLAIGFLRMAVAEEDQLPVAGNAELESTGKRSHPGERPVARERIGAVGPRHHLQREPWHRRR